MPTLVNNPYFTSGYLDPNHPQYAQVYVLRNDLEDVVIDRLGRLDRPCGSYIYGPRQSGKTSLLHRVQWHFFREGWKCAYVAVSNALGPDNRKEWYTGVWRNIAEQLGVWASGAPACIDDIFAFEQALRNCARSIQALRVLIIVEEIDTLISEGEEWAKFLRMIRQLDQGNRTGGIEKWVFVLGAYASPLEVLRKLPAGYHEQVSPLFNTVLPIRLEDWSLEGTKQLTGLLDSTHIVVSDLHILIHDWTDGHPYLTNRLLSSLYINPSQEIRKEHVETGVQQILADDNDPNLGQHLATALRLRVSQTARISLQHCVKKGTLPWEPAREEHLELHKIGLVKVQQVGSSKQMIIRNKIYQEFLKGRVQELKTLAQVSCPDKSILMDMVSQAMTIALTVAIPFLAGWWMHSHVSLTPTWKDYSARTLGQISWLPPRADVWLLTLVAGLVSYVLINLLLYVFLVQSKGGSRSLVLEEHSNGVAPVVLVFDQVCKDDKPWNLQARFAKDESFSPISVSMDLTDRIRWSGEGDVLLTGDQRWGEVECQLSRGAQVRYMLFPWPDRWIVPLHLEWDNYRLPVRLEVIADASEALPHKLMAPVNFIREVVKGFLLKGGGKNGSS